MSRSSGCESVSPRRQRSFLELIRRLAVLADAATVSGERERRFGQQAAAASGAHFGIDLGVLEVLDGAGASARRRCGVCASLRGVGPEPLAHRR
jgi:hypothetical protein